MDRPFQCDKCKNWYTPVPVDNETCMVCFEGKHAANPSTGMVDCHFGHMSSTHSEVTVAIAYQKAEAAKGDPALLPEAEVEYLKVPNALSWAGVKEMPGMTGEPNDRRFRNIDAIELMVIDNRRPASDLVELRRSIKLCGAMASEIPGLLVQARATVVAAPPPEAPAPMVEQPEATVATPTAVQERMARVRAARKSKQAVSA